MDNNPVADKKGAANTCMMKKIIHIAAVFILTGLFFTASAQVVTLDYYFNHETHKNRSGQEVRFHYMWEDTENSGFSILGEAFKNGGAKLQSLESAPTIAGLKGTNIYIIVDPDTKKETAHPNYIEEKDIKEIEEWVKAGGVLVMLANDSTNVELPHFNNLAAKFGMHFNDDLQNHVIDDNHFQEGAVVTANNPIFKTAKKIFMKDVCSIDIRSPAYPGLRNSNGAVIIAVAKYGKGTVLAVGDPWLYNEYTNGRLPAGYENDKAADDVASWLIKQIPRRNN
ncbi:MAG: unsaturated rhamnogalacturonyl hydrolase [Mucilaginibacter sp.]|nr:unsaturated rhamnogalacturonyl hydrolase [Mucilaginibacter sp.]